MLRGSLNNSFLTCLITAVQVEEMGSDLDDHVSDH